MKYSKNFDDNSMRCYAIDFVGFTRWNLRNKLVHQIMFHEYNCVSQEDNS